jgi:selenocysteine lyase/cysteine desulfurase
MPLDLQALRAATPALEAVVHLDHAGSSLPSQAVHDAVLAHLERERTLGGYRAHAEARDAAEAFYPAAARMLGCAPEEVAFQPSATVAWQAALSGFGLQAGDTVLVHDAAYGTNAIAWELLARRGVTITRVPSDPDGCIALDALDVHLERAPDLVALTHIGTNSGGVQPAEAVGRRCRDAGVPFLLDACQSVGQVALDVAALPCDVLTFTGRKYLRGPRATGGLYVRQALLDRGFAPALPDLHGATWTDDGVVLDPSARRFEQFERSIAGQIGLAVALEEGNAVGWDALGTRTASLAAGLRSRLVDAGYPVHDDGRRKGGIVTFTVPGRASADVRDALRHEDVHVSASHRVSAPWHMDRRGVAHVVRASVHAVNTEEELDRLLRALDALRR